MRRQSPPRAWRRSRRSDRRFTSMIPRDSAIATSTSCSARKRHVLPAGGELVYASRGKVLPMGRRTRSRSAMHARIQGKLTSRNPGSPPRWCAFANVTPRKRLQELAPNEESRSSVFNVAGPVGLLQPFSPARRAVEVQRNRAAVVSSFKEDEHHATDSLASGRTADRSCTPIPTRRDLARSDRMAARDGGSSTPISGGPAHKSLTAAGPRLRYAAEMVCSGSFHPCGRTLALRLALPDLVRSYVDRTLSKIPDYRGEVGDIDIHLWRGV